MFYFWKVWILIIILDKDSKKQCYHEGSQSQWKPPCHYSKREVVFSLNKHMVCIKICSLCLGELTENKLVPPKTRRTRERTVVFDPCKAVIRFCIKARLLLGKSIFRLETLTKNPKLQFWRQLGVNTIKHSLLNKKVYFVCLLYIIQ